MLHSLVLLDASDNSQLRVVYAWLRKVLGFVSLPSIKNCEEMIDCYLSLLFLSDQWQGCLELLVSFDPLDFIELDPLVALSVFETLYLSRNKIDIFRNLNQLIDKKIPRPKILPLWLLH